jgi:hypothetical protein
MAENSTFFLLLKVLSRLHAIQEAITSFFARIVSFPARFAARRRDAKLKRYQCSLVWQDSNKHFMVDADVKAENEDQARQLSNVEAARRFPVLKPLGGGAKIIPPYTQDPKAALTQWQVKAMPLRDTDRDLIAEGRFGPAAAEIGGWSSG